MMSKEEMREGFEAWHCEQYKTHGMTGAPTRDMHNGIRDENYCSKKSQALWECWQETGGDVAKVEALKEEIERVEAGKEPVAWFRSDVLGCALWKPGATQALKDGAPLFARSDAGEVESLREELAQMTCNRDFHMDGKQFQSDIADTLQQRLTAAEKRNAELIDRLNTVVEQQKSLIASLRAELEKSQELSVTNILLDVVPGFDGMGEEVFAKSVAEVCEKLGELALQAEELDSANSRLHEVSTHCATVEQELERLRAELGECKGEYDRAVNKVDALRDQLTERDELIAVMLARLNKAQIFGYDRNVKALSARAEPVEPACCTPTAEEKALLASGDYTPEELWGGSRPTCPKCIKVEPANKEGAQ